MRRAGQASGRAFTEAMRQAWAAEKDLTAFLEYKFKRNGCDTSAYVPVVAGGKVCCIRQSGAATLIDSRTQARSIMFEMMMCSCMPRPLLKP